MNYLNLFLPADPLSKLSPSQNRVGLETARSVLERTVGAEKLAQLDGHLAEGRLSDAQGILLGSGKMESVKLEVLKAISSA